MIWLLPLVAWCVMFYVPQAIAAYMYGKGNPWPTYSSGKRGIFGQYAWMDYWNRLGSRRSKKPVPSYLR